MKVYIVIEPDPDRYYGCRIKRVFSTPELAEQYYEKHKHTTYLYIDDRKVLDELPED